MNLVGADIERRDGGLGAVFGENRLRVDGPALAAFEGRRVILGIRPEDLKDAVVAGPAEDRTIGATVDIREDLGAEVLVHFAIAGPPVRGEDVEAALGEEALEATSEQARRQGALFTARVARESRVREGEKIELAVDTSRLHFFDPATGDAID